MRVAVVGAGITGLALTHHLAERGVDAVTFEARDEPGGVIRSETIDGHVVETGPQRLRLTPGVRTLVEAAGVEDAVVEAGEERLFVYADGRLREAPLDVSTFLRTDLLSWRGKLRLLAEPLTRAGMAEETAAELFARKFGREAYERFIGPLYGGIYGSDPAEMPAKFALDGLLEREAEAGSFLRAFRQRVGQGSEFPPISFESGNQQLPRALAHRYADRIEFETPVRSVRPTDSSPDDAEPSPDESGSSPNEARPSRDETTPEAASDGGSGGRYVVETPDRRERFDHVVVTTPAGVAAEILDGVTTGTEGLADLTYNPLAIVHLLADCDREGFGYQIALDEEFHTLGASWNDSMFDRDRLYTVFLGGMHEPGVIDRENAAVGEIAAQEFETVMGVPADVLNVATRERWFPAWDQSWYALEAFETPPGIHLATNYTARMGIPSRVREAKSLAAELAETEG